MSNATLAELKDGLRNYNERKIKRQKPMVKRTMKKDGVNQPLLHQHHMLKNGG